MKSLKLIKKREKNMNSNIEIFNLFEEIYYEIDKFMQDMMDGKVI
jgi:hypothetical protein